MFIIYFLLLCCTSVSATCRLTMTVHTYVSEWADHSDEWLSVISDVESEFPNVTFQTTWVTPDEIHGVQSLPKSLTIYNNTQQRFKYSMTRPHFRRWVKDALCGHFSLFETITLFDNYMSKHFPYFVHILSDEKPQGFSLPHRMPEVGFFWSFQNVSSRFNTILTRGQTQRIHQYSNFSTRNLLHTLLPPIIPRWLLNTEFGDSTYQVLAKREVLIVSDDPLPNGWLNMIHEYPQTGFVHLRTNETDIVPVPSVWFRRRSVDFMIPSIGPEVREWLQGIRLNKTKPYYRKSKAPDEAHSSIPDVTGDGLWNWLDTHNETILYFYGSQDDANMVQHQELLAELNITLARMNLTSNDHEYLNEKTLPGSYVFFQNKRKRKSGSCRTFSPLELEVMEEKTLPANATLMNRTISANGENFIDKNEL